MDYTKIPAALIYRQRQSLDEFIDSNNLIAALVDNMFEIDYLNKNDFERSAKDGLNAAFYICTIIMLEKRPEWRWTFYLNEADYNHETAWDIYDGQEFVMALVYVLLHRFNKEWSAAHQPLMRRLFEYNFPNYRFDNNPGERAHLDSKHKIIRKLVHKLPAGNLPDDIFAPCDINDDAIEEAEMDMAQTNMRWQDLTNNYDQKTTKILMDAICKNETERISLALAIGADATDLGMSENVSYLRPFFRKAIGMPAPDSADEQIDDLLWPPQIPEEDIDNATAEAEGNTGVESNSDEVVVLKARIKELETENQQLSKKNGELEAENKQLSKKNGELEAELKEARTIPSTVTALQKVRMELARQLLLKAGVNLKKWGNKDKAGTVMSTMLDNIPASTCKTYVSDPSINKEYHKEIIDEINKQLESLELDFRL